jgi:hypothetical protein
MLAAVNDNLQLWQPVILLENALAFTIIVRKKI